MLLFALPRGGDHNEMKVLLCLALCGSYMIWSTSITPPYVFDPATKVDPWW